jgi:hypothetical protein
VITAARSGALLRCFFLVGAVAIAGGLSANSPVEPLLAPAAFEHHIVKFNAMEPETVVNAIPNAAAWEWLKGNVPRFECSDASVEEIYWFRWWSFRKHLKRDPATDLWVMTEFLTKPRPISSALGHHLMEGRWLREQSYCDDYVLYWLRGNKGQPQDHLHKYSQWLDYGLWQRWLVTQDTPAVTGLLDDLVKDYRKWETDNGRPDGLFWQYDVRDAMEESISGGRKVKNVRPTISSYMYGNAVALVHIARLAGRPELAAEFETKARNLRQLVESTLWNKSLDFFGSVDEQLAPISVREEIGFIPWYFELPETDRDYAAAWRQFTDPDGFAAPFGITTAERRHPQFRTHGTGSCEWDGAVWPFATSQTLTGLANLIDDYPAQKFVSGRDWYDAFLTYTRSQHYDGLPYIGEYLDEKTGAWLKGRDPRSIYYNHSTYADLVITGLVGLRPRPDDVIEVAPLTPADTLGWFALDGVRYHGHDVAIWWDRDGTRYHRGTGLSVLADGKLVAHSALLERVTGRLP